MTGCAEVLFCCSIFDSDGEFLLIEAAESLPAWVSPSNAENRVRSYIHDNTTPYSEAHGVFVGVQVWLYRSHLHLVPIFYHSLANTPRIRRRLQETEDDNIQDPTAIAEDDDYLGPADALRLVQDPTVDTIAPDEVERAVWRRISACVTPFI